MNIREALDTLLDTDEDGNYTVRPEYLTSLVEEISRSAWETGFDDSDFSSDHGVTEAAAAISNS